MKEDGVEDVFIERVRRLGGRSFKFAPLHVGNPDRIVLLPGGGIYLVELKADDGVVEPAQTVWHKRAAALGTRVHIVRGSKEAREWLPID